MDGAITFFIVVLCAYFSSRVIYALIDYRGMSVFLSGAAPLLLSLIFLIFFKLPVKIFFIPFPPEIRTSSHRKDFFITIPLVILWLVFSKYLPPGPINAIFGCISFCGIASFLLLFLSGRYVSAFVAFLVTFPFIRFLELQSMYIQFSGTLLGPFIVTPLNLTIFAFVFFYFVQKLVTRQDISIPFDSGTKLYLLFVFFCLVSTLLSSDKSSSLIGFLVEVLIFPFFFIFVRNVCKDKNSVFKIFYGIFTYIFLRLLFTLYLCIRYKVSIDSFYLALSQIEVLTTLSTMMIPLCFGLFIISIWKRIKLVALIGILIAFYGIIFGDKREPIVTLLLTTPFLLLLPLRFKKVIILSALVITIGLIIYYGNLYQMHLSDIPLTLEMLSRDSIRMSAWGASLGMIKDYPFWGIGFGNFSNFLDIYSSETFYSMDIWPLCSPHNFFLHYLTSVGILAAGCLFLLIAYVYRLGMRIMKQQDTYGRTILVVLLWSLSCFLIAASTGGTMVPFSYSRATLEARIVSYIPDFGLLFWLFMGLISCLYSQCRVSGFTEQSLSKGRREL
jgi:O-antigen ligase